MLTRTSGVLRTIDTYCNGVGFNNIGARHSVHGTVAEGIMRVASVVFPERLLAVTKFTDTVRTANTGGV